jgi:hypothetical protein
MWCRVEHGGLVGPEGIWRYGYAQFAKKIVKF